MSITSGDPPMTSEAEEQGVEDFLGMPEKPAWKRLMKFWLPGILVVFIILLISTCSFSGGTKSYITEDVVKGSLDLKVTATGNLRPINQVTVGAEVTGPVDQVLVDVNDRVTRGQVIAIINTEIIDQQIAQGRANLNARRASLVQAEANLEADAAQLARFREVRELSEGRVPSQIEMERAEAAVARGRAAVDSAQANIEAAEATLGASLTTRSRAVIRAPVTGVVLARQIEPGQTVVASFNTVTLFVIAEDLAAMQLRVAIDEADVGQVATGQNATFTVDAYPGKLFPASVQRVDLASGNTLASQSATTISGSVVSYEARLMVQNPEGLLRPGMTATASIATQSLGDVLLVPNAALRFRPQKEVDEDDALFEVSFGLDREEREAGIGVGSRQMLQVLQEDGSLREVEVITGQSDGRQTAVSSDELEDGMKVVTGLRAIGR
jgi:HlyD family secretion protein